MQYVWLPTNTAYVPSAEAIEEVSIVTNSYTAEVGMAGGAAINVVVKSGTNAYRGTGWVYDTDADWRARNSFQTTPDNPKNVLKQYGANHGGRIVRDRLFFFFNVERTTQRSQAPAAACCRSRRPACDPSAAGDVVFPTPEQGGAIIYDPASNADPALRTPFPNNTIPADRIDQAALYLIERLPATTGPGYANNIAHHRRARLQAHQLRLQAQLRQRQPQRVRPLRQLAARDRRPYALGEAGGGRLGRRLGRPGAGPDAGRSALA